MSNLPDGCTQADCDRAAEGDRCGKPTHGELNMDGTCDWCEDEREPEMDTESIEEFWARRSRVLFERKHKSIKEDRDGTV